jgi:hypothetical protein
MVARSSSIDSERAYTESGLFGVLQQARDEYFGSRPDDPERDAKQRAFRAAFEAWNDFVLSGKVPKSHT